jgi:hypothetical protein
LAIGKDETEKKRKNENYKLQITNYKQITIPKLQITKKEAPFGQLEKIANGQ